MAYYLSIFLMATVFASCGADVSSSYERPVTDGKAGSMARFAITGDYLYTVDNTKLNLFNISTPTDPKQEKTIPLSFGVETIFPYGDNLFIGTQSGMHIFDIKNPASPQELSHYEHIVSCDPVVTDGRYAYITLSAGRGCGWAAVNQLQVVDLQNIRQPVMVAQYQMKNPKGLAIYNGTLFVCDEGLVVYDATDVKKIKQKAFYNIKAYDIIPDNGYLLVIGSDGLYQYRYEQANLELLSKISIQED